LKRKFVSLAKEKERCEKERDQWRLKTSTLVDRYFKILEGLREEVGHVKKLALNEIREAKVSVQETMIDHL